MTPFEELVQKEFEAWLTETYDAKLISYLPNPQLIAEFWKTKGIYN